MLIRKWKTFILFGFPTLQEDVEDGQPLPASTTGWRLISTPLTERKPWISACVKFEALRSARAKSQCFRSIWTPMCFKL
ncbi:uncharacterized protein LOC142580028 isoform X6 [Dermacentor variabilis]|uniref:uncharacterized protein LOC142580028 isoform X6 n=1 Tax=Dermacentor variabilis TaxID=34621 RepID=UPI003F5B6528